MATAATPGAFGGPVRELAGALTRLETLRVASADKDRARLRLAELQLDIEPGFWILAIRRDNRYLYRPRGWVRLEAGDELIATGPHEGRKRLGELCGWSVVIDEDDPTGEVELKPLRPTPAAR